MRSQPSVAVSFLRKNRFYLAPIVSLSLCFVAGCIAVASAGESGGDPGFGKLPWEMVAGQWGALGVMVLWFMARDKEERRDRKVEHTELVKALTKLEAALTQSHANDEKNRLAIYKWADTTKEVCIKIDGLCSAQHSGTRIIPKV